MSTRRSRQGALALDSGTALSRRPDGPIVLAAAVGDATGARAAAAALACAGSEPDRAALLIDVSAIRPPRPSLISTVGARQLEQRLAAHLADANVASRGRLCQLSLPTPTSAGDGVKVPDRDWLESLAAALPLARESAAIVHLPASLVRLALAEPRIAFTGALLRADLNRDRALTALAVGDLIDTGLRVAVLKRPLPWLAARAALLGALPGENHQLPPRATNRLLHADDNKLRDCYDGKDDEKGDRHSPGQGRVTR